MIARAFVAKFKNVVPKYVTLFDINLGNEEGGLKWISLLKVPYGLLGEGLRLYKANGRKLFRYASSFLPLAIWHSLK